MRETLRATIYGAFGGMAIAYGVFVAHFGVNVPFMDDWAQVGLMTHKLSLSSLWAQHNENRMIVPNLIALGIGTLDRFNIKTEMLLSWGLLLIVTLAIMVYVARRSANALWCALIPATMFCLCQWEDALWGFQVAWYLVLAGAVFVAYALDRKPVIWFTLALVSAGIASFSSLQGLFVFPMGLVLLVRTRPVSWSRVSAWVLAGALTSIWYFKGFQWTLTGTSSLQYLTHHVMLGIRFYLVSLGAVVYPSSTPHDSFALVETFGAFLLAAALFSLGHGLRHSKPDRGLPLGLIVYALLFFASLVVGRLTYGLGEAESSRYTLYALMLLTGLIAYWGTAGGWAGNLRVLWLGTLAVVVLLVWTSAIRFSLPQARDALVSRSWAADVLINLPLASNAAVTETLYPDASYVRSLYVALLQSHLTTFSSPLREQDSRLGLQPATYFVDHP